jgi:hypothetical protein
MVSFAEFVKENRIDEGQWLLSIIALRFWVEKQICVLKDRILVIEEGMLYDELVSVGNNQYVGEYDFLFGKLKFCEEMLEGLR